MTKWNNPHNIGIKPYMDYMGTFQSYPTITATINHNTGINERVKTSSYKNDLWIIPIQDYIDPYMDYTIIGLYIVLYIGLYHIWIISMYPRQQQPQQTTYHYINAVCLPCNALSHFKRGITQIGLYHAIKRVKRRL